MPSLKELKDRIGSVKSTQKITKAKQMVAAAKLRRAQAAAEAGRPYAERLGAVMASLAGKVSGDSAPKLLAGTGSDQRNLLVVVNTDKGLCGGLNSNLVKAAKAKAQELQAAGKTVEFYLVGKKGRAPLKRDYEKEITGGFDTSVVKTPGFEEADAIAAELIELFEARHRDGFEIVSISLDHDRKKWRAFVDEHPMRWRHHADGRGWRNRLAERFLVDTIPHTILVGRDGKVAAIGLRGAKLRAAIDRALRAPTPTR